MPAEIGNLITTYNDSQFLYSASQNWYFFTAYRRTAKKSSPLPTSNSVTQYHYTNLGIYETLQPIAIFIIYTRLPPSPNALRQPAWWTPSTWYKADLNSPLGIGWPLLAGRWGANQAMCTGSLAMWCNVQYRFTRATSIYPRITVTPPPPYPTSHSPGTWPGGARGPCPPERKKIKIL